MCKGEMARIDRRREEGSKTKGGRVGKKKRKGEKEGAADR